MLCTGKSAMSSNSFIIRSFVNVPPTFTSICAIVLCVDIWATFTFSHIHILSPPIPNNRAGLHIFPLKYIILYLYKYVHNPYHEIPRANTLFLLWVWRSLRHSSTTDRSKSLFEVPSQRMAYQKVLSSHHPVTTSSYVQTL